MEKQLPLPTSQTRTVLSAPPEARVKPLGEKATLYTGLVWPLSVKTGLMPLPERSPVRFQSLIVISPLPEARVEQSGENATLYTFFVWLFRMVRDFQFCSLTG